MEFGTEHREQLENVAGVSIRIENVAGVTIRIMLRVAATAAATATTTIYNIQYA